jgi:SPP1 gp7 family putative phage head morphogenesis protein
MATESSVKPETRRERRTWAFVRRAEISYAQALRQVARQVGMLSGMFEAGEPIEVVEHKAHTLENSLKIYAKTIEPWAKSVAGRMLADVSRRDEAMWNTLGRSMSRALRAEIANAPTGLIFQELMAGQVALITSLPLKAAQRVHELVIEGRISTAGRAKDLATEIKGLGDTTVGRANLIARTETARAASNLVEARAKYVGSEGYVWRTSGDVDVREEHQDLEGTYHKWSEPPIAGKQHGQPVRAHPGTIWNCRCFAEPVIPTKF